jgi:hypothetical protein
MRAGMTLHVGKNEKFMSSPLNLWPEVSQNIFSQAEFFEYLPIWFSLGNP